MNEGMDGWMVEDIYKIEERRIDLIENKNIMKKEKEEEKAESNR